MGSGPGATVGEEGEVRNAEGGAGNLASAKHMEGELLVSHSGVYLKGSRQATPHGGSVEPRPPGEERMKRVSTTGVSLASVAMAKEAPRLLFLQRSGLP